MSWREFKVLLNGLGPNAVLTWRARQKRGGAGGAGGADADMITDPDEVSAVMKGMLR